MEVVSQYSDASAPPTHVAVIMDGNGRWAKSHGLPRIAGHKRGVDRVREVIETAADMGIAYLTLFGFSSENWNRPQKEVSDLMGLLRFYLRNEIASLNENGIRLRIIGDRDKLPSDIVKLVGHAEELTAENTKLYLTIALSYGGRAEIASATKRIAEDVRSGRIRPEDIDEQTVGQYLLTWDLPDPDLLIRTSGEQRISNFLLWQLAYTEFLFVDKCWPDFDRESFVNAVSIFHRRERRYGTISA